MPTPDAPPPVQTPTGPFSWTDVYRAVRDVEERVMKRLDDLGEDFDTSVAHEREERALLRERVQSLELWRAANDGKNSRTSSIGDWALRLTVALIGFGQLLIAGVIYTSNQGGT